MTKLPENKKVRIRIQDRVFMSYQAFSSAPGLVLSSRKVTDIGLWSEDVTGETS